METQITQEEILEVPDESREVMRVTNKKGFESIVYAGSIPDPIVEMAKNKMKEMLEGLSLQAPPVPVADYFQFPENKA